MKWDTDCTDGTRIFLMLKSVKIRVPSVQSVSHPNPYVFFKLGFK
jgi:hypothetical protein